MSLERDEVVMGDRYAPSVSAPVLEVKVDQELAEELARIPKRMAFKIGDVAEIVGVKPYVLRYWETEFEILKPKKSKSNQRMYEPRDVENLLLIKKLLYRDRFSIEGARVALKKIRVDHRRVKQIHSIAEHLDDTKDRLYSIVDRVRRLKTLIRTQF